MMKKLGKELVSSVHGNSNINRICIGAWGFDKTADIHPSASELALLAPVERVAEVEDTC